MQQEKQPIYDKLPHFRRHNIATGMAVLAIGLSQAYVSSGASEKTGPAEQIEQPAADPTLPEPDPEIAKKDNSDCLWITDKPSGYYIGYACKGDTITKLHNSYSRDYIYGVIRRNGRQICGWVESGVLTVKKRDRPYKTCMSYFAERDNRYLNGSDFNCPESECVDGKKTELTEDCDNRFYRNSASSKKSPTNLRPNDNSGFYDYAGQEYGPVRYRFEKRHGSREDGKAVVVNSPKYGWGEMSENCIDKRPSGGPEKNKDTVAGKNPNSDQ